MKITQRADTYEMDHLLTYYECDETGHPTMGMLMSMFSMVSDAHSIFLGMDNQTIMATGGAWVITGYAGTLEKEQPHFGDHVVLGTRAVAYNRFFALREFWLRAPEGKVYAKVQCMFVFMDLHARKLEAIPPQLIEPFHSLEINRLPRVRRPHKLLTDASIQQTDYHVRFFDIDVNHHVNNARYFDWLLAPLGDDFLRAHRVRSFAIQYSHEVRPGRVVTSMFTQRDADGQLTSQHRIMVGTEECTTADFEWY